MLVTKVNRRYAKSLLELAEERGELEAVKNDMDLVAATIKDSHDFRVVLKSPVINPDKKEKIVKAIFDGKVSELTSKFLAILTDKGREGELEGITKAFENLYNSRKGIEEAVVTTAFPMDEAQRNDIQTKLAQLTGHDINIVEKVDAALIGGMKVRVGDRQYNGSLAYQLDQLKRQFKKNSYQPKF